MTVGEAIRRIRLAGAWEQEAFAGLLEISAVYVSKLENDEKVPSLKLVRRIAALPVPDEYRAMLATAIMDVPAGALIDAEVTEEV